ncbi:hypothetical protein C8R45DRAFT_850719 [Mycena sanguinolenta]|nr:hypothetical protein C8R45DRAFT_850719 [Mycena sanguinolenta]
MLPPQTTDADAGDFKTSNGGHWLGGIRQHVPKAKARKSAKNTPRELPSACLRELKELTDELGYVYVSWDGRSVREHELRAHSDSGLDRNPLLILDRDGRIIAVFVSAPEDPEWQSVADEAAKALKEVREEGLRTGAFAVGHNSHRRGRFLTLKGGVSHGGGQKHPGNICNPPGQLQLFNALIANKYIRRICGFQSSAMRTYGPKLFQDYVTDLQALFAHHRELCHNFTNSILPAVTFNLGPQSVTFEHVDDLNRALGWCAITCAGNFDPQTSAHLYMKQLKLVVEFPPAATSLLPSAVIAHGNTPLSPSETRYSITQYAAGGLFRYVKYGFKTTKELLAHGGRSLKRTLDGDPGERHKSCLDLFSKVDELMQYHAASFGA